MAERRVGFHPAALIALQEYEDWHWWFQRRNELVLKLMERFAPRTGQMLEIGCGNGLVTKAIADRFPEIEITGTEYFHEGLDAARRRIPTAKFKQLDARDLDGSQLFDCIGAFDVLEHIDDDVGVMLALRLSLKKGGRLFVTVPQHSWLWSEADVYAKHERRYSRKEMIVKLERCGFKVIYTTSYVSLLIPLMFVSRMMQKKNKYDPMGEFRISPLLNGALSRIINIENWIRNIGVPLNVGGSLVVVATPI